MNFDNNKLYKMLNDAGYSQQLNESFINLMVAEGIEKRQLNEMVFEWLGTLGYAGQYSERVKKWYEDGFALSSGSSGPFTTSAAGPYLVSPAGLIPTGTSKITVAVECTPDSEALQGLFTFGSNFYGSTNSAGAINIQVVDDGGSDVLSTTRTGKHKLLAGQLQTIILSVDLVGSLTVSRIDSGGITIIGSYPITQPNSGAFNTGLALTLLRDPWLNSQFMGSVDAMRVWFGAATTDGTEPVATPDIEITGPASAINSHPWKQGADAT